MRRILLHVLPSGFHRIRHYRLPANCHRKNHIATARELLQTSAPEAPASPKEAHTGNGHLRSTFICRHCGASMIVINTFEEHPCPAMLAKLTMSVSRSAPRICPLAFIEHCRRERSLPCRATTIQIAIAPRCY